MATSWAETGGPNNVPARRPAARARRRGAGSVGGSRTGSPASSGVTLEADWVPFGKEGSWLRPYLNLKLGAQYTHYFGFNGSGSDTDGFGRDAGDNDTVFLFAWLAF